MFYVCTCIRLRRFVIAIKDYMSEYKFVERRIHIAADMRLQDNRNTRH